MVIADVDGVSDLVNCSHFTVYRIAINGEKTFYTETDDSFTALTCIEGEVTVTDDRGNAISLHKGESCLIPAMAKTYTLKGKATLIDALN